MILVGHADTVGQAGTPIDFVLTDVVESLGGTAFSINGRGAFRVPLLGEHNAMNALMAIAVARRIGLSDEQIAAGLAKVLPAEGRLEPMRIGSWSVIHDAYNANPSSMEAALKTFARLEREAGDRGKGKVVKKAKKGRKVVILGDMLELGPTSEAMHRSIGAMVAAWGFDLLIAIGPAMEYAADTAGAAGVRVERYKNTAARAVGAGRIARTRRQSVVQRIARHGRWKRCWSAAESGIPSRPDELNRRDSMCCI